MRKIGWRTWATLAVRTGRRVWWKLRQAFQTLPGATFVVNGAPAPADVALASVGARAALGQGWTLTGQFDAEVGAGWNSYGGTAKIAKAW